MRIPATTPETMRATGPMVSRREPAQSPTWPLPIRSLHRLAGAAIAARSNPTVAAALPAPAFARGLADAASGFAGTFAVALVLVLVTLVPALLLARQPRSGPVGADPGARVLMH